MTPSLEDLQSFHLYKSCILDARLYTMYLHYTVKHGSSLLEVFRVYRDTPTSKVVRVMEEGVQHSVYIYMCTPNF